MPDGHEEHHCAYEVIPYRLWVDTQDDEETD